ERLDDVAAHQLLLTKAGELEHVTAAGEHARVPVADDEPGPGRRVVVLEQLEEEAEAAALARDGLVGQPLAPVVVDRTSLAVRTDEVRHAAMVATSHTPAAARVRGPSRISSGRRGRPSGAPPIQPSRRTARAGAGSRAPGRRRD